MNLGEQTGQMIELEPVDDAPAAVEVLPDMAPVGPTVADPVTGEVGEHDPALVER